MIALDIETTGLNPGSHCMLSLGAVHIASGKEFYGECKIYDESKVSSEALEINGFTTKDITDPGKPYAHELYLKFHQWCLTNFDEYLLAGENLPSFDVQFLKHYHNNKLEDSKEWIFGHRYIDLHTWFYAETGKSCSLNEKLEYFGEPKEKDIHNALQGAKLTAKVLKIIQRRPKNIMVSLLKKSRNTIERKFEGAIRRDDQKYATALDILISAYATVIGDLTIRNNNTNDAT